jgi:hypothetical protein
MILIHAGRLFNRIDSYIRTVAYGKEDYAGDRMIRSAKRRLQWI